MDLVRFTALTWTQLTSQISIGSFYSGVFKMIMCVTMFLIALMQLGFTSVAVSFLPNGKGGDRAS